MPKKIPKFEAGSWSYVDAPSTPKATTPVFLSCDINNWPAFAKMICDPKQTENAVANEIHWKISDETKNFFAVEGALSDKFQKKILSELNDFIHEPGFYDAERFANVQLTDETRKMVESDTDLADLVRLNALILQDSFPNNINFVPYVGPRPFEEADSFRFFGRDREAKEFVLRIVANPEVLLFAPSGAGKSSLIRANLIPMLRERDCDVLPVASVHPMALHEASKDKSLNPFVLSCLIRWTELDDFSRLDDNPHEQNLDFEQLKSMSLPDYFLFRKEVRENEPRPTIAFLDQFEEVFAYGRHKQLVELFEQLSDSLDADPTLRVVFSMRGDRLDQLAKYIHILPQKLPVRLRLDMLDKNAALDAITKPLEYTHRSFAPGVAEKLAKNLRTIRVKNFEQEYETIEENVVEPVQLQVVCQSLWNSLPDDVTMIGKRHVQQFANVEGALAAFYERCINSAVEKTKFPEGVLRQWFSRELITPDRTRGIVFQGKKKTENMPNRVVDYLGNLYIIRRELFGKQPWYRLAHDRFIEPILQSNKEWEQRAVANVAPLIKQLRKRTIRWRRSNQDDKELLGNAEIISAEKCLAVYTSQGVEIDEAVQSYVNASKEFSRQKEVDHSRKIAEVASLKATEAKLEADAERLRADAERLSARNKNIGLMVLAILFLVGGVVAWVLNQQQKKLIIQARQLNEKHQEKFAYIASKNGIRQVENGDHFKGMLWYQQAIEADPKPEYQNEIDPEDERRRATYQARLNSLLMQLPRLNHLWIHPRNVTYAEFSSCRERAVCIFEDGLAKMVDCINGKSFTLTPGGNEKFTYAKFGPHGRVLLTVSGDQVQLWDSSTGKRTKAMKHDGIVTRVWFSPNGDLLLTSTYQPIEADRPHSPAQARLWNIQEKPAAIGYIQSTTSRGVSTAWFDRDGKRVFLANGKDAELRDTETFEIIGKTNIGQRRDTKKSESKGKTFAHDSLVVFVTLSKDGKRGVTVTQDETVWIWDLNSRELILNSKGLAENSSLNYSNIEVAIFKNKLLVKGKDNAVSLWTLPSGQLDDYRQLLTGFKPTKTLQHGAAIKHMAFSPDGKLIVTCGADPDSTARLWKSSNGSPLHPPLKHEQDVSQAAFSPDGRFLATASRDRNARIWHVGTGQLVHSKLLHNDSVSHVAFDKYGLQLCTINTSPNTSNSGDNRGGEIRCWDLYTRNARTTHINHYGPMTWSELSSDGKLVVSTGLFGNAVVSNANSGRLVAGPFVHPSPVAFATFSPNCKRVASFGADGTVHIWDIENNRKLDPGFSLTGEVQHACFDTNGKRLLTISRQPDNIKKNVQLWDLKTGDCILSGEGSDIENMAVFNKNGECVAFAIDNNAVRIWNLSANKKWTVRHDEKKEIHSLNFSADGSMLVTASSDDTARIWDIRSQSTEQKVPSLKHSSDVNDARFSADGSKVVTASSDGNVRIWDVRTGQALGLPLEHRQTVMSARFCRDDSWLVTLCHDKRVRIWDANTRNPITPALIHSKDLKDVVCIENQHNTIISVIGFDDSMRKRVTSRWSTANVTPIKYQVSVSHWPIAKGATNKADLISLLASHRIDEKNGLFPLESRLVKQKWDKISKEQNKFVGSAGSSSRETRLRQIVADCEAANELKAALFNQNALISLKEPGRFKPSDWQLYARRCRINLLLGDRNAAAKDYDEAKRLATIQNRQPLMDWLSRQAEDWLWTDMGGASQKDGRAPTTFFLDRLERLQGDNPSWLLHAQLSLVLFRKKGAHVSDGVVQEAIRQYQKAKLLAEETSDLFVWLKRQLQIATSLGQIEAQGFLLDRLIEFSPDNWELHQRRGEVYFDLSDYEGALEKLNKAIEANSDSWVLLVSRANAFGHLGVKNHRDGKKDIATKQFKAAIADYTSAIKNKDSQKERYDIYRKRATYYKNIGRFDKAIEDYWSAFARIPRDEKTFAIRRSTYLFFRDLESAYQWFGNWKQAVVDLTKVIESYPEYYPKEAGLYILRGKANINSMLPGKKEINSKYLHAARADFDKAIELSAGQLTDLLHTELTAGYVQQEDWENAEKFTKLANLSTDEFSTLYNLARIYLAAEKLREYRDVCEQLSSKFGSEDMLELANSVAWSCALAKDAISDLSVAEAIARRAVSHDKDNRYYLNTLGAVLYRNGKYKEAIQMLNKAIAADPDESKPVWDAVFLAMCHHDLGEGDKAQQRLGEAIEWSEEVASRLLWKEKIELHSLIKEARSMITPE